MFLGQPENAAERAAEQQRLKESGEAREHQKQRIRKEVIEDLACGNSYAVSTASVARRHKLGKGATIYVRQLTADLAPKEDA